MTTRNDVLLLLLYLRDRLIMRCRYRRSDFFRLPMSIYNINNRYRVVRRKHVRRWRRRDVPFTRRIVERRRRNLIPVTRRRRRRGRWYARISPVGGVGQSRISGPEWTFFSASTEVYRNSKSRVSTPRLPRAAESASTSRVDEWIVFFFFVLRLKNVSSSSSWSPSLTTSLLHKRLPESSGITGIESSYSMTNERHVSILR